MQACGGSRQHRRARRLRRASTEGVCAGLHARSGSAIAGTTVELQARRAVLERGSETRRGGIVAFHRARYLPMRSGGLGRSRFGSGRPEIKNLQRAKPSGSPTLVVERTSRLGSGRTVAAGDAAEHQDAPYMTRCRNRRQQPSGDTLRRSGNSGAANQVKRAAAWHGHRGIGGGRPTAEDAIVPRCRASAGIRAGSSWRWHTNGKTRQHAGNAGMNEKCL